eukprot:scaffold159209_cov20-Tisochrysis_lutea.AAC.1
MPISAHRHVSTKSTNATSDIAGMDLQWARTQNNDKDLLSTKVAHAHFSLQVRGQQKHERHSGYCWDGPAVGTHSSDETAVPKWLMPTMVHKHMSTSSRHAISYTSGMDLPGDRR